MEKLHKKKRTRLIIIGSILLALIIFRLFLPSIVLHYVNKKLQEIEGYTGHVDDIDIALYRGAYQIIGLKLEKTGGKVPVPFFSTAKMDISLEWKAIFKGRIVGEIIFFKPQLNFVKGPNKAQSQTSIDKHWTQVIDELIPVKINRLEIVDGEIHYRDTKDKPFDLFLNNMHGVAHNLSNVDDSTKALPAGADATANAYGDGKFQIHIDMDPLKKEPTFDLNARLTGVKIVKLNDFLVSAANVDANAGTFSLYTEIAAKNGSYEGYVKPIIKDLDLIDWSKEKKEGFFHKLYETLIGGAAKVLENRKENQIAAKVPFSGKFGNPDIDLWATIGSLLRNAFIQALRPTIDNTVSFTGKPKTKEEIKQEKKEKKKEEKKKEE